MTQQYRPPQRRSSSARLVVAVVLGLAAVLGVAAWANALSQPVVRAGVPTGSVAPPQPPAPATTAPAPSRSTAAASSAPATSAPPSPSATPTAPSSPATPSATPAKPATPKPTPPKPTPTRPADPFATSTARQDAISGAGKLYSFIVRVEKASGLGTDEVAAEIAGTLNDPRGWAGKGTVRFALVADPKKADFTVYVSTPTVADKSCDQAAAVCVKGGKLVLGAAAWKTPAKPWGTDVTGFRRYLVNNAVGTYLGEDKASCSKAGRPAPVMSAQTSDLKGCTPNPWPEN